MSSKAQSGENKQGSVTQMRWSVDRECRLLRWDEGARKRFELNPGVVSHVGLAPEEILPAEQAAMWRTLYQRAIQEGPFHVEYELEPDHVLELEFRPTKDGEQTTGVEVTGRDISKRKWSERALIAAEKKYRELVNGALAGIFQTALNGRVLSCNPSLAHLFGYENPEELMRGLHANAKNVWADPEERRAALERLQQEKIVRGHECRFLRKDGSVMWVALTCRQVEDEHGNPLYNEGYFEDISERRRLMEELRAREARQRKIFMENGAVMLLMEPESGQILDANHAAAAYYGYSREQLLHMSIQQINTMPPEATLQLRQGVLRGELNLFHFQHRLASGKVRDVEAYANPVEYEGRTVLYSIVRDITEQRKAEAELREADERYRAVFEQGPMGIALVDFDGRVLRCNHHFADLIGYSATELLQRTVAEITVPEDLTETRHLYQQLLDGKLQSTSYEKRYQRKDGGVVWVRAYISIQRDAHGTPLNTIGFVEDIQDHVAAKQRLAAANEATWASEVRYRTAFQTSLDAIAINRLSDGQYIDVNRAFHEITGYSRQDVLGQSAIEMAIWVHPADRERMLEALHRDSVCRNLETPLRRKDGSTFLGLISATLIDISGEQCHLAVIRDISAQRATEEQAAHALESLHQSELHYRTIFQNSPDALTITRAENSIYLDVNPGFEKITGYTRDEVIGIDGKVLDLWEEPQLRLRMFEEMEHDGVCKNLEARFRRKDGSLLWGLLSSSRIEIDGLPCFMTTVRDISEQKESRERVAAAAEALRQSETRYRTIFQTTTGALALATLAEGRFLEVNPGYESIFGYSRDDLVGHTSNEVHLFADAGERARLKKMLRQNPTGCTMEVRYRRKNGEIFWGQLSVSVVEIENIPCTYSAVLDISAQKEAAARIAASAEALRQSELRYRTIFQTGVDGLSITDAETGEYLDVNRSCCEMVGYKPQEMIGRSGLELDLWVRPSDRTHVQEILCEQGECNNYETHLRRRNGEIFWARMSVNQIELDGRRCNLALVRDITEQKESEERVRASAEAVRQSELRYRTIFQAGMDGICIVDFAHKTFLDVNQAFLQMFGYTHEQLAGHDALELGLWANMELREQMLAEINSTGVCRNLEVEFNRASGEIFWVRLSASLVELDGTPCILGILRDISDSKAAEEEIRSLAFYDPLTRLPNRRLLLDRISQGLKTAARNNTKMALLFLDLDDFKGVNDTLGHKIGDLMLAEVARRMSECVRKSDTVARLGGDEFVIMLSDLAPNSEEAAPKARLVAEKLLASIREPFYLDSHICHIRASVGVTIFGDCSCESCEDVLQQADIAMYQAKSAGYGVLRFFAPALQSAINSRALLEEELNQALAESQFRLHYQPQYENGRIFGVEALLRWQHPTRGLLLPADFLPLSEESGQIVAIGSWVMDAACRQLANWAGEPLTDELSISVNISPRQFRNPEFATQVLEALDRYSATPQRLRLEIAEGALGVNLAESLAKLNALSARGISFALDDFGTGATSFSALRRLPLQEIKIDRSFVADMLQDEAGAAIVHTIIALGRGLGLKVIAVGVETEEQRRFFTEAGCYAHQGHLYCPALPLDQLLSRLHCG